MIKKKICIVTGTRAEYGLLRWVIDGVQRSKKLELQIITTGMHLSPEFGLTYNQIENDGYFINKKIEMLLSSDTSVGITKSMGIGLIGFAEALADLKPDFMLVLGDRFEIFSAVTSAMIAQIPVGHIHGGESTEGLIDESIRHSITKMSQFHFVATEKYRKRVIQLGEKPSNVFLVGGLGVDSLKKIRLLSKQKLEKLINFKFGKKNLLVTFHPVTLEKKTSEIQMKELLDALACIRETKIIFTMPNADTDGRVLFQLINEFLSKHSNSIAFTSLGQLRYFSCIQYIDAVLGNSSSGLLEIPSFKKATIDIGDRQKGRVKAESVISCEPEKEAILKSIRFIYSKKFKSQLEHIKNPYGDGGASESIIKILNKTSFEGVLKKKFYDIPIQK